MAPDNIFQRLASLLRNGLKIGAQIPVPPPPLAQGPQPSGNSTRRSGDYDTDWRELFGISSERRAAYRDYQMMEVESSVIEQGLNQLADGALNGADGDYDRLFDIVFEADDKGESAEAKATQKRMDEIDKKLGLRRDARQVIREFALMGDHFREVVFDGQKEIVELRSLPCESMVRVPAEGPYAQDGVALQQYDIAGTKIAEFHDWQIVQWGYRIRPLDLYGRSVLYAARRPYRQLQAIEDGMVVNRLTRSTQRNVWVCPVGEATGPDAKARVDEYARSQRRVRRFDPATGRMMISAKAMDEERDLFIATGTKVGTGDIKALNPQPGMDKIEDVLYFHRKVVAALGVPAAYLGFEKDTRDKAVITAIDVAYARRLRSLQRAWGVGLRQIFDSQLVLDGASKTAFTYQLAFAPVATVDELRMWQVELLKAQVCVQLKTAGVVTDDDFLLRKIMEYEEDDIQKIKKANVKFAAEQAAQFAAPPSQFESRTSRRSRPRVRVGSDVVDAVDHVLNQTAVRRQMRDLRSLADRMLLETVPTAVPPT